MSEIRLLDYAFQHPSVSAIKGSGAVGVMRYLSHSGPPKDLTADEVKMLHDSGLSIGLVYESTSSRAGQGRQAGIDDATYAYDMAHHLGAPGGVVIFFAVDFDANPTAVLPYLQGVASVATAYLPGVYGSLRVVDTILAGGIMHWGWQTVAWSGGKVSTRAHLYQRGGATHPVAGTDENVLMHPLPLWLPAGAQPHVIPAPAPTPSPVLVQGDRMIIRFHSAPDVFEVVGSHREHITRDAYIARGRPPVQDLPDDHPLAALPVVNLP